MKIKFKILLKKLQKEKATILAIVFLGLICILGGLLFISYAENDSLKLQLHDIESEIDSLSDTKERLESDYQILQTNFSNIKTEYTGAYKVPYVVMRGREAEAVFERLNGELVTWTWSADSFENSFTRGYHKRDLVPNFVVPSFEAVCNSNNTAGYNTYLFYHQLCNWVLSFASSNCASEVQATYDLYLESVNNCTERVNEWRNTGLQYKELGFKNGSKQTVVDFTEFVEGNMFVNVIDTIYDPSMSDRQVIEEIWNVNSQLTTYSFEIQETPRYSLETLSEGGGDCEDKAILVASLLKAVPKDWKVELVYMDSDNPSSPKEVNHMLVFVDTGTYQTFIETTSKGEMNPYGTVVGWRFPV